MRQLLAFLMAALLLFSSAQAEAVLRTTSDIPGSFAAAYPEVSIACVDLTYDQILSGLLTRTLDVDVFYTSSNYMNLSSLIDKGYCLDLSGSELVRDTVSRLYPAIAEQITRGDAIYAVPRSLNFFNGLACHEANWTALGYTEADVPKSFPALLDFLESWVVRNDGGDLGYNILGYWDETLYNEHTYGAWLVQELLESWIDQAAYAGAPLRFNTPELIELLERSIKVGEAIYHHCEPRKSESGNGPALFQSVNPFFSEYWETMERWMIDMRPSADAPSLTTGSLGVLIAYSGTAQPELAIKLLEENIKEFETPGNFQQGERHFLFTDAEPLPQPNFEQGIREVRNDIAIAEHRLAGDDTPLEDYLDLRDSDYERPKSYDDYTPFLGYQMTAARLAAMTDEEAEDELERFRRMEEYDLAHAWQFSPEALDVYRRFAQGLVIEEPGAFAQGSEASHNYYSLVRQYGNGLISVQQLVAQLDHIAQMVEMENMQ